MSPCKQGKARDLGPVTEESPGWVLQEGCGLSGNSGSLADGDGETTEGSRGARMEDGGAGTWRLPTSCYTAFLRGSQCLVSPDPYVDLSQAPKARYAEVYFDSVRDKET